MIVAALFCRLNVPGDPADLFGNLPAGTVKHPDGVGRQFGKLPVFQVNHIAGVRNHGGNVRSKEIFPNAHAQNQGAGFPYYEHPPGFVGTDNAQSIGALQTVCRFHHCLLKISLVVMLHQVDNHFRIGFTFKMVALFCQFPAQLHIVFNDAVMHHRKPSVIAGVGVGIGIRGSTVGGPAGMPDSGAARHQAAVLGLFAQIGNSSGDLLNVNGSVLNHRNARRVIAPVFQLLQALQQNRRTVLGTGVSHNSAHRKPPDSSFGSKMDSYYSHSTVAGGLLVMS